MLTFHLLLAKFFLICSLTDWWMFLSSAVSPAILGWAYAELPVRMGQVWPRSHHHTVWSGSPHHGCCKACSQVNLFSGSFSIKCRMKSLAGAPREKTEIQHDHACGHQDGAHSLTTHLIRFDKNPGLPVPHSTHPSLLAPSFFENIITEESTQYAHTSV